MSSSTSRTSRRGFLKSSSLVGMGAAASILGCSGSGVTGRDGKTYKAAFSNVGLKATWCAHGMDTAVEWGKRLGIDVTAYDSEFSIAKQRRDVEDMAVKSWDFVAIQSVGIQTLTKPVRTLIERGIPVIAMDTRMVPEGEDIGLWTFVTPDHVWMAKQTVEAIARKMEYRGNIVHTQGALSHSGAQARAKGFHEVIRKYPDIKVIDEQPGDWDSNKVAAIWDDLLVKHKKIDGAFFHNDDMAIAAVKAVQRSGQNRNVIIGSIDGQDMGIQGVLRNDLAVSVMNPSGRIHWTALMVGYQACALEQKKADVPSEIIVDSPILTPENARGFEYLTKLNLI